MQIKHTQKFNAPAEYVFQRATDFAKFESQSGENDITFKRIGRAPIHIGTQWEISLPYKGRKRRFTAELTQFMPPRVVSYTSKNRKYQAVLSLTFTPSGPEKCKMDMLLVARSHAFSTSLVFNTIRLARKRINQRIRDRMQEIATRLETEYRQGGAKG